MAESAPLEFDGITPAQFAAMGAKAREAGIALDGNSGTAEKFGVEVRWDYAPDTGRLVFEVLKTPFFVKADDVVVRLRKMVEQSLA